MELVHKFDFNMRKLFHEIDELGSGVIDFNNLKAFLMNHGIVSYEEEVISILRRLDRDDDGTIDFQEFSLGIEPFDSSLKPLVKPRSQAKLSTQKKNYTHYIRYESPTRPK